MKIFYYKKAKNFVLNDNLIIKLSVVLSLLGIILLFILSNYSDLDIISPSKINQYNEDDDIIIRGTLHSVNNRGTVTVLKISEIVTTDVIIFDDIDLKNEINKNVFIRGVIRENRGKKEIFGTSIRIED